jgi:hypothetical protein
MWLLIHSEEEEGNPLRRLIALFNAVSRSQVPNVFLVRGKWDWHGQTLTTHNTKTHTQSDTLQTLSHTHIPAKSFNLIKCRSYSSSRWVFSREFVKAGAAATCVGPLLGLAQAVSPHEPGSYLAEQEAFEKTLLWQTTDWHSVATWAETALQTDSQKTEGFKTKKAGI